MSEQHSDLDLAALRTLREALTALGHARERDWRFPSAAATQALDAAYAQFLHGYANLSPTFLATHPQLSEHHGLLERVDGDAGGFFAGAIEDLDRRLNGERTEPGPG